MKLIDLTSKEGQRIAIPIEKITGVIEPHSEYGCTFVATGADGGPEGGENGWYVAEKYIDVRMMLERM